jgi:hypothetical protein
MRVGKVHLGPRDLLGAKMERTPFFRSFVLQRVRWTSTSVDLYECGVSWSPVGISTDVDVHRTDGCFLNDASWEHAKARVEPAVGRRYNPAHDGGVPLA